MVVIVRKDTESALSVASDILSKQLQAKPESVLGLPTGKTAQLLYRRLIGDLKEGGADFSKVITFNLDEYLGLPAGDPQSFRSCMKKELFEPAQISDDRSHLPNPTALDLEAECRHYEKLIRDAGGIDLQILGLGGNGHIGFNEPGSSFKSRTRVAALSQKTIEDNAKLFPSAANVPRRCITMGIGTILEAKQCLLIAFGKNKAPAVAAMINGPISERCPASALRTHPNFIVLLDSEAASELNTKSDEIASASE